MTYEKMLIINWNDNEACTYYVDKNKHSVAHDHDIDVTLDAYEGTYSFCKCSELVTLFDGVNIKPVKVKSWKLVNTPAG